MTTFELENHGSEMTAPNVQAPDAAGWFTDPRREHRLRYFSGSKWTEHVTHFGPQPCGGCSEGNV